MCRDNRRCPGCSGPKAYRRDKAQRLANASFRATLAKHVEGADKDIVKIVNDCPNGALRDVSTALGFDPAKIADDQSQPAVYRRADNQMWAEAAATHVRRAPISGADKALSAATVESLHRGDNADAALATVKAVSAPACATHGEVAHTAEGKCMSCVVDTHLAKRKDSSTPLAAPSKECAGPAEFVPSPSQGAALLDAALRGEFPDSARSEDGTDDARLEALAVLVGQGNGCPTTAAEFLPHPEDADGAEVDRLVAQMQQDTANVLVASLGASKLTTTFVVDTDGALVAEYSDTSYPHDSIDAEIAEDDEVTPATITKDKAQRVTDAAARILPEGTSLEDTEKVAALAGFLIRGESPREAVGDAVWQGYLDRDNGDHNAARERLADDVDALMFTPTTGKRGMSMNLVLHSMPSQLRDEVHDHLQERVKSWRSQTDGGYLDIATSGSPIDTGGFAASNLIMSPSEVGARYGDYPWHSDNLGYNEDGPGGEEWLESAEVERIADSLQSLGAGRMHHAIAVGYEAVTAEVRAALATPHDTYAQRVERAQRFAAARIAAEMLTEVDLRDVEDLDVPEAAQAMGFEVTERVDPNQAALF